MSMHDDFSLTASVSMALAYHLLEEGMWFYLKTEGVSLRHLLSNFYTMDEGMYRVYSESYRDKTLIKKTFLIVIDRSRSRLPTIIICQVR